jgi:hypothetical protein
LRWRWGLISAGEETAGDDDRALPSVAGEESESFSEIAASPLGEDTVYFFYQILGKTHLLFYYFLVLTFKHFQIPSL